MFRVRWERRALQELARVWEREDSETRQAITAASNTVDQRLRQNPLQEGSLVPKDAGSLLCRLYLSSFEWSQTGKPCPCSRSVCSNGGLIKSLLSADKLQRCQQEPDLW
jgi:hypothetical protein